MLLYACNHEERFAKVDLDGFITGEKIDDNWRLVKQWNNIDEKFFKHKNDSTLSCRTKENLIYVLAKGNIDTSQIKTFRTKVIKSLNSEADSIYKENVAGMFSCYQYLWIDTVSYDEIHIFNCKQVNNDEEVWSWSIEIINNRLEKL